MVLKPYGSAVDIKAGAGAFSGDKLIWVVNTHSAAAKVTAVNSWAGFFLVFVFTCDCAFNSGGIHAATSTRAHHCPSKSRASLVSGTCAEEAGARAAARVL